MRLWGEQGRPCPPLLVKEGLTGKVVVQPGDLFSGEWEPPTGGRQLTVLWPERLGRGSRKASVCPVTRPRRQQEPVSFSHVRAHREGLISSVTRH